MHDFGAGLPWRRFLEKIGQAHFSAIIAEFLRRFGSLDDIGGAPRPTTFACLPAGLPSSYSMLLSKIVLARAASLAPSKTKELLGKFFR